MNTPLHPLHGSWSALSWQQLRDDIRAMAALHHVNDKYDRQLIRLSGWEW